MMHTDEEIKRWWASLSKTRQAEILGTMVDKAYDPKFALSLSKQYEEGREFSPKQLDAIKKWDR